MRTIKLIILLAFASVFNFGTLFAETIGFSTIYTKGGKAVEVILRTDISDKLRYIYDAEIQKRFPNATLLNSATTTYNCHSYAWNLSDGGNTVCWINDSTSDKKPNVANFWNDGYYYETTEANAKKIHYFLSDHSAIVSPAEPGMYESKWGEGALMRHAPDYGPYLNMSSRKYYNNSGPEKKPEVKTGLITCSIGDGLVLVNQNAGYFANMGTTAYSTMEYVIETAKGDDAVEEGYAVITSIGESSVGVKFTKAGMYEMWIRFYNQHHQLVGEFTYEPIVVEYY